MLRRSLLLFLVVAGTLGSAVWFGAQLRPAAAATQAPCEAPSAPYPTLASALIAPGCDPILLGSAVFNERVTVGRSVTVQGQGAAQTILDGRLLGAVVTVQPGLAITLRDLTVRNGSALDGGGVVNGAGSTLTLERVLLTNNRASRDGAGIFNNAGGTVNLIDSRVELANSVRHGGAVYNEAAGVVTLINSDLITNTAGNGAAVHNRGAMTMTGGRLVNNRGNGAPNVQARGGAIHMPFSSSSLVMDGVLVAENAISADGGAIHSVGWVSISDSTVVSNTAQVNAGAFNNDRGTLTLSNVVLAHNQAGSGGAVRSFSGRFVALNTVCRDNTAVNGGCLYVSGGVTELSAVDFLRNRATDSGGAVWVIGGQYTAVGGSLRQNSAQATTGFGGGIYALDFSTNLSLTNLLIEENLSNRGGGIFQSGGALDATGLTLRNNQAQSRGGGLELAQTAATLRAGLIEGNDGAFDGGGVSATDGSLQMTGVVVRGNAADTGGGLSLVGTTAALLRVVVSANTAEIGGGIYNAGNLALQETAVVSSTAVGNGGGIYNASALTARNTTISGNQALSGGGLFNNGGQVAFAFSTIAANQGVLSGGGLRSFGGAVQLRGAALAQNLPANCQGEAATLQSEGHNLADDASCLLVAVGDRQGVAAGLAPLANNGGETLTHALQGGSPLLDAAPVADCPSADQRGVARPVGAACDIGALESTVSVITLARSLDWVAEENGLARVDLRLSLAMPTPVTVRLRTEAIEAQPGSDYQHVDTVLTFAPGQKTLTAWVGIVNDPDPEGNESFRVVLNDPANAQLGEPSSGVIIILDDELITVMPAKPVYTAVEGNQPVSIDVVLARPALSPGRVRYTAAAGTAVAGVDFVPTTGVLEFQVGQVTAAFTVQLLDDALGEPPRSVRLTLSDPDNLHLGMAEALLIIQDDGDASIVYLPVVVNGAPVRP